MSLSTRDTLLQKTLTSLGVNLWDLSQRSPVLLVFVRHLGCTYCRETLGLLHQARPTWVQRGIQPVIVYPAQPGEIDPLLRQYGLQDVPTVADPERRLYALFELPLGRWGQLFGWKVVWRAVVEGVLWKYGLGMIRGEPRQLGGAVLIDRGQIVHIMRAQSSADQPDFQALCEIPPNQR
ncbi:MAG: hypothetical protein KatS3mg114_0201 [Planctomycetaceae bacterium]|nr:MAG: hypothetical protein KatS3mg114_0201 [Planctomycetaceae bacterium]